MTKTGKKITKIARAAGQFSKPRSNDYEMIDNKKIFFVGRIYLVEEYCI